MTPVLKPKDIIAHLRSQFQEKLPDVGQAWNKASILQVFDMAVGATALWYADCKMEARPTLETPDEQIK